MFMHKAMGSPKSGTFYLKVASLRQALALLANIRQGWKSLPGTDTLAYHEDSRITDKKVYNIGPWTEEIAKDGVVIDTV